MLVDGIDVDYCEKHDFGDEFKKAASEGKVCILQGCTRENVMEKIREVYGGTPNTRGNVSDNQAKYSAK